MTKKNEIKKVTLKEPLLYGNKELTEISFRKPKAGDLRDVSLIDIGRMNTVALFTLLPRISTVAITEAQLTELGPSDLVVIFTEINSFFD